MRGRWLSGASIFVLMSNLLLPAAVHGEEEREARPTGFHLQASNGYKLSVIAVAAPDGAEGQIGILVRRADGLAFYSAPATVTSTTIDADLGRLGRIFVARVKTGRMKTVRRGCPPARPKRVEVERYEGIIEFRGEEGFTEASATSAPLDHPAYCLRNGSNQPAARELPLGARVDVEWRRRAQYRVEFNAEKQRPGAKTGVSVEVTEHRGEMEIGRAAWTLAGAGALRYDAKLRKALVKPPTPFSGYAAFRRNARPANRWTGDLSVDLPGRSDVPLTGRGFSADLERPRR